MSIFDFNGKKICTEVVKKFVREKKDPPLFREKTVRRMRKNI